MYLLKLIKPKLKYVINLTLVVAIFLLFPVKILSQQQTNENDNTSLIDSDDKKEIDFEKINKEVKEEFKLDSEIDLSIIKDYRKEIYNYNIWRLNHIKRAYTLQLYIKISIFISVIIVLFLGLFFSYLQFKYSVVKINNDKDLKIEKVSETKLKLGKGEIEISSSVIGLIILLISVIFFYLYLEKVFPIQDINYQNLNIIEESQKNQEDQDNEN